MSSSTSADVCNVTMSAALLIRHTPSDGGWWWVATVKGQ